jgi:hypothetical protein
MSQQSPSPEWLAPLDDLLSALQDERTTEAEDQLAARLGGLDPDLLAFLVGQVAEQETPEAAGFLEIVAGQPGLSDEVRARARAGLGALAERGIVPAAPGAERFLAGYVQRARERGEQIMLLGWRLPSGSIEALVYLLDWRGDGLKDFYITRQLDDAEWRQLVEHNASKGALLEEISLAEARALLRAAIAEGQRFSRPLPREYKLTHSLSERRILNADVPEAAPRSFVAPDLAPEAVVTAYVAALHYRDYALAAELLAAGHPLRAGRTQEEAAQALRAEQKQVPRREEEVEVTPVEGATDEQRAVVEASGEQVAVEKTGKRVRSAVRERYTLAREDGGAWRIAANERVGE